MPDKLADCRTHGPDAELLIVEGDSAAGPAKAGRNAEYMAVLPLRGKVVNAGKSTLKQVIENAEAQALFTAIGAGSGKDFDLEQARATDASSSSATPTWTAATSGACSSP